MNCAVVEPPVRIELTTARLQDGLAYLRRYSRGFATAVKAVRGQGKYLRACSRVSAGVVTPFTATCDNVVTPSHVESYRRPSQDLIDARHGQPGRFGELLTGDARLEALADQTAQLGVGVIECAAGVRTARPDRYGLPSRPMSTSLQRFGDSRLGKSRLASAA